MRLRTEGSIRVTPWGEACAPSPDKVRRRRKRKRAIDKEVPINRRKDPKPSEIAPLLHNWKPVL